MKISYNWLQTYFKEKLPAPEKVAEAFTFHAFEVESVENIFTDTIFDIKVLPDRAHYALCHRGIALELATILKLEITEPILPIAPVTLEKDANIQVDDTKICSRYTARLIENIEVKESPIWIKDRLEAVGQRSINNIVDITNYILLDKGQPLHAFDADKIKGTLVLRNAKKGESLVLLDGREIKLDESVFIEADDKGPLAIAGIKGGKNEGIEPTTKNIILVAGNFDAATIRKTSTKLGIRSDASKRFENNLSPYLVEIGMKEASSIIYELLPKSKIGKVTGLFPNPPKQIKINLLVDEINSILGIKIPTQEIIEILKRLEIEVSGNGNELELAIPLYRNDLLNVSDLAEEIGRIYGYDKLPLTIPSETIFKPKIEKTFYYSEKIKSILAGWGFSEVYTYSLVSKGVFEIEKPLAADKNYLRANLTGGIVKSLELNSKNADLLGLTDDVKIFEIGKVFCEEGEHTALTIGIKNLKKKQEKEKEKIKKVRDELLNALGARFTIVCPIDHSGGIVTVNNKTIGITNNTEGITELNLDALVNSLPEPTSYDDLNLGKASDVVYEKFSTQPFIVRDIALFVSTEMEDDIKSVIINSLKNSAGELLVKGPALFDQFEKEGKKSFAFRMIFQSMDRTLSDEEVNKFMEKVYEAVKGKGWQVR